VAEEDNPFLGVLKVLETPKQTPAPAHLNPCPSPSYPLPQPTLA
jgi:hypothetical protein